MKSILFVLGILFVTAANSATLVCPSLEEIKQHHFNGWLPLYQEGEELASNRDIAEFNRSVTGFLGAKWSAKYLESAHCFYVGHGTIVSQIVLAQDAWRPVGDTAWIWLVPDRFAECFSPQMVDCLFIS